MTTVVNPTGISITDSNAVAAGVTSFKVLVGTAAGGPYTTSSATVAVSAMTDTSGVYTAPFTALTFSPALQHNVPYYCVCQEENATGAGPNSPEASFQTTAPLAAPTAFSFTVG